MTALISYVSHNTKAYETAKQKALEQFDKNYDTQIVKLRQFFNKQFDTTLFSGAQDLQRIFSLLDAFCLELHYTNEFRDLMIKDALEYDGTTYEITFFSDAKTRDLSIPKRTIWKFQEKKAD